MFMTGTLFAFGCSHTAGHSLKKDVTADFLKSYYRETLNANNYDEFNANISEVKKEKVIHKWNKKVLGKKVDYPENSYSAHLAKLLNLNYKNFARSGSGIDTVYKNFTNQKTNIDWKTDIVTIEMPPIYRYRADTRNIIYGLHYNKLNKEIMPAIDSMEYFYAGIISLLNKYPVHFVNVMADRHQDIKSHMLVNTLNSISLDSICKEHNMPQYPTGHFWHESHLLFAHHLMDQL